MAGTLRRQVRWGRFRQITGSGAASRGWELVWLSVYARENEAYHSCYMRFEDLLLSRYPVPSPLVPPPLFFFAPPCVLDTLSQTFDYLRTSRFKNAG